jgi:hypothetical protein
MSGIDRTRMLCGGYFIIILDEFYKQFTNSDFYDTVYFSLENQN